MKIHNPKTLPEELIKICNYYADTTRRPFDVLSFVGDPSPYKEHRKGVCGQYFGNSSQIHIYLARIQHNYRYVDYPNLPPGIGEWLSVLEVFLHEFGHHIQVEDPDYVYDYDEMGYWNSWPERHANNFAYQEIHRLATLDKSLFAPQYTRDLGYLGIHASNRLRNLWDSNNESPSSYKISELREARLRAIHIGKNTIAQKVETIIKEKLEFYPGYFCEDFPEPESIEDTYMGYASADCFDLCIEDYPPEYFGITDSEEIPEPIDFSEMILSQSGLRKKELVCHEYSNKCIPNPLAKFAEKEGIVWADKLGRKWRYLELGQAIDRGLLEHQIKPNL